jgi:hypothetical protein
LLQGNLQAALYAMASDAEILRHRHLPANPVNTRRTFFLGDQIPVGSLLHLTIDVIHVKRCAGSIASRVHATKMSLKSCFDHFCCPVWLGLCRILTKPSNDSLNVVGGISRANEAHRLVQATRDTPMDRRGSKLERISQLACNMPSSSSFFLKELQVTSPSRG